MAKKKKIKICDVETLIFKIDNEGFDYCFTEYSNWTDEFGGTELEEPIKTYQAAQEKLSAAIEKVKQDFGLEE